MSLAISGTAITFPDASTQNTAATGFGFKNRIINGAMMIDQRGSAASAVNNSSAAKLYALDRFGFYGNQNSKFSVQQTSTAPVGFTKSLKVLSSSAYTVGAVETFTVSQVIEGNNVADLGWGTASAKAVTLSFQVYSSLTGTFGGAIGNGNGDRSYPFSYSIPVANTWTTISVTIAGDTAGTWATDNSSGIAVYWGLGVGSTYSGTANAWAAGLYVSTTGATSVVGTNGATFYITGVQLEKGSTATSFDYRPYGTELALCQRYYFATASTTLVSMPSPTFTTYTFKVSMRATPTVVITPGSGSIAYGVVDVSGLYFNGSTTTSASMTASSEL